MIGFLQRVTEASVTADGGRLGGIDAGLMVLVGVQREDDEARAERLADRLLAYRVFPDADGRMNLDVRAAGGGLLLVPQFTLVADTARGNRPGFSRAAAADDAERLFRHMLEYVRERHSPVAAGRFGAYMQVSLVNDGPVSFWLQVP